MAAPFFEAERKWIDLLKCSGIDYFKFSESQALVGQFDPARLMMDSNSARVFAERVSVRLSKVLGDHKVKSLGLSMDVRVFGDFVEKDKGNRAHSPVSDAYIEMFKQFMIGCMSRVDGSAHTVAAMTVSFVLDGGK